MILNRSDGLNLSVVLIFAENILLDQVLQKKANKQACLNLLWLAQQLELQTFECSD